MKQQKQIPSRALSKQGIRCFGTVYHSTQSGIALLTAIFVVALATIAAVALLSSSAIALRRSANLQESEQASWYAEGIESWARSLLAIQAQTAKVDALGDAWAQPIAFIPIDQGRISGRIEDLQGRFNLNNLGQLNPQPYYGNR